MRKVIATNDDKNLRFVQVVEEDTFGGDLRDQVKSEPLVTDLKECKYELHCVEERLKNAPESVERTQVLFKLEEAKMWLDKYIRSL